MIRGCRACMSARRKPVAKPVVLVFQVADEVCREISVRYFCVFLVLFAGVAWGAEWNDLSVLQINREEPHATMMVYPDAVTMAMKYDRTVSPWFQSLNGEWKFNWVRKPADRPVDFYKPGFDVSGWNSIPVPSQLGNGRLRPENLYQHRISVPERSAERAGGVESRRLLSPRV